MISNKTKNQIRSIFKYFSLSLATIFSIAPIYWAIVTSLKNETAIVTYPPQFFPIGVTVKHYIDIFSQSSMQIFYRNSLILATATILIVLFLSAHAGYAASRFEFHGKNTILFIMLSTMMIPGIVTLIPLYLLSVKMGIHNTYLVLVLVYSAWQIPTAVWLLRAFFDNIPKELEEAAMIDGCSHWGAFYRVVLPLTQPGLAAAAIIIFVWVWNEFIIALNLTSSESIRPITVGLYFFVGENGILWGRISAAAVVALLPVIVLFAFLQKRFIAGLTAGAVKG